METRKIQMVSGGTYTVSLPKEWAESEDIAAGTVVNLHAHLDGLLVVQKREYEDDAPARTRALVDYDDPEQLEQTVRAAYAADSTEIILDAEDAFTEEQRRVVDRVTRNLTGVTVVDSSESQVIVRTLLDSEQVSVRQSVRQLQYVALSMQQNAMSTVTDNVTPDGSTERDEQADRLYAMIERHFIRGVARLDEVDALGLTRSELFELWATARELERVADHAEDIVATVAGIDEPVNPTTADELSEIARTAREVVEDAVSVVVGDAAVETARQALRTRDSVREEAESVDRRLFESAESEYQLRRVLDRLRRTAEHGGNIAERGIQGGIRRNELGKDGHGNGEARSSNREFQA